MLVLIAGLAAEGEHRAVGPAHHPLGDRRPGIRVVGLTAYDDQALREAMERAGASDVLVKGASIRQIVDAIAAAGSVPR